MTSRRYRHFSATIYARQQPRPLVGDEHFPNGSVGLQFGDTGNMSTREMRDLVEDLRKVLAQMEGRAEQEGGA